MRLPTCLVAFLSIAFWGISEVQPAPPSGSQRSCAREVIVFTANQSWLSRIYVMGMDGLVLDYFEYERCCSATGDPALERAEVCGTGRSARRPSKTPKCVRRPSLNLTLLLETRR